MSELENNVATGSSIAKVARVFNNLPIDDKIRGMKTADILNKQILAAKQQSKEKGNPVKDETPTVTAEEIKAEMYREMLER